MIQIYGTPDYLHINDSTSDTGRKKDNLAATHKKTK